LIARRTAIHTLLPGHGEGKKWRGVYVYRVLCEGQDAVADTRRQLSWQL